MLALLGGVCCVLSWWFLDRPLAFLIHRQVHGLAPLMEGVSLMGDKVVLTALLLVLLFGAGLLRWWGVCRVLLLVFVVFVASACVTETLKIVLGRSRPLLLFHGQWGFHFFSFSRSMWSMPSGHVTLASTLVTLFFLATRRRSVLWGWALVLLIAISRLLLNRHYMSDVMVSSFLGSGSAFLGYPYARTYIAPWADRYIFPAQP